MTYHEALQEAINRGFSTIYVNTCRYIEDELSECNSSGEAVYAVLGNVLVNVKTEEIYDLDW